MPLANVTLTTQSKPDNDYIAYPSIHDIKARLAKEDAEYRQHLTKWALHDKRKKPKTIINPISPVYL